MRNVAFCLVVGWLCIAASQAAEAGPPVFVDQATQPGSADCVDNDPKCSVWASQGECQSNAAWMMGNCRRSCQSCQGGDRAWKLRTQLAANYDNTSAPQNFSINNVMVESLRIDHIEVDERNQVMRAHGKLVLTWNDTRVKWEPSQWGISWLNFYWIQIWTPQIIQTNAPNALPGTVNGRVLAANYTGQVFMWTDFSLAAVCNFDYSAFPSDRQHCCFKLDDKRYFAVRFKVNEEGNKIASESALETHISGWKVSGVNLHESKYVVKVLSDWHRDPYDLESTNLDICINVDRNAPYYRTELVGPAMAAAVITLTSFLAADTVLQLWLLIASLVLQLLAMAIMNARMPLATEGNPTIMKFYGFNLSATTLIFLLTALLHALSRLRCAIPPPYFVDKLVSVMERILPCVQLSDGIGSSNEDRSKLGSELDSVASSGGGSDKCYYAPMAGAIKCLIFLIFLVIYSLVMIACFVI